MDPALVKQAAGIIDQMMKSGAASSDQLSGLLNASGGATEAATEAQGFLAGVPGQILSSLLMPSFTVTSVVFLTLLSFLAANRARSKGRSFWVWFVYAYTAAYIAVFHVLFLKEDEDGILHREGMVKCPFCGLHVKPETRCCPICRHDLRTEILTVPRAPSEMKPISIIFFSLLFIIASKYFELKAGSLLSTLL